MATGPPRDWMPCVVNVGPPVKRTVSGVDCWGVKVQDVKIHSEVGPRSDPLHTIAPDRASRRAVVCIALVASLGVLPWLEGSMFADEGATLYSGRLSWSDLWAQSQHVDLVLLPYYVLIHFWMLVSGNIAWVRAISLLAFFGTIIAIGWTGLRIAGRWCGIIASVLTATSTLLVEKSLNARPYELSTFVVVVCALVLFRWLEDSRTRWLWAFSFLALLATALQLFSLLAPVRDARERSGCSSEVDCPSVPTAARSGWCPCRCLLRMARCVHRGSRPSELDRKRIDRSSPGG